MTRHTKRVQRRQKRRPKPRAKITRWKDVTFTLDGVPMPVGAVSVLRSPRAKAPREPIDLAKSYTCEATFTIAAPDPGDLRELAWAAVVTPSAAAPAAFLVLVDALLERGLIKPPPTDEEIAEALERAIEAGEVVHTYAAPKPLLEQAWEWAREATFPPLLERFRLALESAWRPEPPTIETVTGTTLDMFAEQLFGITRMIRSAAIGGIGAAEPETDEELRARCRAVLDRLRPPVGNGRRPDLG